MGSHTSRAFLGWELTGKLAEAFSLPKFIFQMEVSGLSLHSECDSTFCPCRYEG